MQQAASHAVEGTERGFETVKASESVTAASKAVGVGTNGVVIGGLAIVILLCCVLRCGCRACYGAAKSFRNRKSSRQRGRGDAEMHACLSSSPRGWADLDQGIRCSSAAGDLSAAWPQAAAGYAMGSAAAYGHGGNPWCGGGGGPQLPCWGSMPARYPGEDRRFHESEKLCDDDGGSDVGLGLHTHGLGPGYGAAPSQYNIADAARRGFYR